MGSRMKDVQRKLDLSLEDLVEESKTNGGTGGRGSGRKRRRVQSDDKGDTEKGKDDERQDPPAENGKREKKRENEEKPEKPEKARRDSHVPRRTEVDLAEASGARKTGRPPASSSTAPVAHRPPTPGYPIPAWPQTFDPRIAYPAYRPPPPMYLRQPPVFRPAPVPYMMPPAYPHPAPAPAPAPLRIAGPPPHPPPHYPPVAAAPGHTAAPPAVAPSQPSQPSRKRHRERHREPVESGPPPPHGFQVRLSNIPPELTARDLAEAFTEVSSSRVESVDLLRDGAAKATGDAVIIFAARPDAQNAVRRYHGGDLNGKRLEAIYEGEVNVPKR